MIRPTYKEGLPDYLCMQVITNEEAERRGRVYDANGRTYLFDLDYNDGDCPFTVDAGRYGNVSHFVNHSVSDTNRYACSPIPYYVELINSKLP